MNASILNIIYLIASVTFILGLKMLSHPLSARRGNLIAAAGMTLAIFGTIFLYKTHDGIFLGNKLFIFGALAIGTLAGFFAAKKVQTVMQEIYNQIGLEYHTYVTTINKTLFTGRVSAKAKSISPSKLPIILLNISCNLRV